MPTGGGTFQGIGEKLVANPTTGTAQLSVPIDVSPGRDGFAPQLALTYDSGLGNGPFGLGWRLGLPEITRGTDAGVPRYADQHDSDVFTLSGADDLIPVALPAAGGTWSRPTIERTVDGRAYRIDAYRPRLERHYARVERWTDVVSAEAHWRSISTDNVTTVYGHNAASRVADPADGGRVARWLISESYDDRGNWIVYDYRAEDSAGIEPEPHEAHRTDRGRSAQRYPKRVRYGNRVSHELCRDPDRADWMFEVVFDYGEHDRAAPRPDGTGTWTARTDAFSTCRAGFEVRTYRLCQRVLMFHHFPDDHTIGADCLVRSVDLTYHGDAAAGDSVVSLLSSVTRRGYRRGEAGYGSSAYPAVEFTYSTVEPSDEVHELRLETDGAPYGWVDLDDRGPAAPGRVDRGRDLLDDQGHDVGHDALDDLVFTGADGGYRSVAGGALEFRALADMTGDGHRDLVRVTNTEVSYWPGLGHGQFGAEVVMSHAPALDAPDMFDPRRVRLLDVDGSGLTDVVYVGTDGVRVYPNHAGNRLGRPWQASAAPDITTVDSMRALDLFGSGASCLVWSAWSAEGRVIRYLDPSRGARPHLLTGVSNNRGAHTTLEYVPSTTFYLQDVAAGQPWPAKPPFPVWVVSRVETADLIGGTRHVSRYSYHHGHFDVTQREFRGFGRVDHIEGEDGGPTPPVLTRTWTHTGDIDPAFEQAYQREYYTEGANGQPTALAASVISDGVLLADGSRLGWKRSPAETREAYRALRGSPLREEIYALDGTEAADRPYKVWQRGYALELLQPRTVGDTPASFAVHPRETVEWHYERALYGPAEQRHCDPRVTHTVVLDVDGWGNVRRSVNIAYPRRVDDPRLSTDDQATQRTILITSVETRYTNPVLRPDGHRGPLACDTSTFELVGVEPLTPGRDLQAPPVTHLFTMAQLRRRLAEAERPERQLASDDIAHAGASEPGPYRRLVSRVRVRYRSDDLTGLLDVGVLQTRALIGGVLTLAYTDELLAGVLRRGGRHSLLPKDPARMLVEEGGYVPADGGWWAPGGTTWLHPDPVDAAVELAFARENFFLPHRYVDAFGNVTTVAYDAHRLLVVETRDAMDNVVVAEPDYRVLRPRRVTDPNGNRTEVAYDRLGRVTATAVQGKATEGLGDLMGRFVAVADLADPSEDDIRAFAADPLGKMKALLRAAGTRWIYDEGRFGRCGQPAFTAVLSHDDHAHQQGHSRIGVSFIHTDGLGRVVQTKSRTHAGEVALRRLAPVTVNGDIVPGRRITGEPVRVTERWVGTGHVGYDDNGNPVCEYEPFFSGTHLYEPERDPAGAGPTRTFGYDPLGRHVATLYADHSYDKVVFDPWRRETWDTNDTVDSDPRTDPDLAVLASHWASLPADWRTWRQERTGEGRPATSRAAAERRTVERIAAHAGTPSTDYTDPLGRVFLTVADNGYAGSIVTRRTLDVQGRTVSVTDARGTTVTAVVFDLMGRPMRTSGPDAGTRWALPDAVGREWRMWGGRGQDRRTVYDRLHRPVAVFVSHGKDERATCRVLYGEELGDAGNHRGRVHRVFDDAGMLSYDAYDFKGNPVRTSRRLRLDHRGTVDWPADARLAERLLETETFTVTVTYDALNRPIQQVVPLVGTGTTQVTQHSYGPTGLLDRVHVWLAEPREPTGLLKPETASHTIVKGVSYDARGARSRIDYGNATHTRYEYDARAPRLARMVTARDAEYLQDISYVYDPVGNVTCVLDESNDAGFHTHQAVPAGAEYAYDAVYRLVRASGREHLGGGTQVGPDDIVRTVPVLPGDGRALRSYVEEYSYDAVGNLLRTRHHSGRELGRPGQVLWQRRYQYALDSNRLLATSQPGEPVLDPYTVTPGYSARYAYDPHGSVTSMPHLPELSWNDRDQLAGADMGGGGRVYYQYDVGGSRVRKVWEKAPGLVDERVYFAGCEIFRRRNGADAGVVLERQTLHIMDGPHRLATIEVRSRGMDAGPAQLLHYQYVNHLGSSTLEIDAQGQVVSYAEYYPFGAVAYQAARSSGEVRQRYRFAGRERDDETGFSYHGVRYYAPWLGRWTSAGMTGVEDGTSAYAYAQAAPSRPKPLVGPLGLVGGEPRPRAVPANPVRAILAGYPVGAEHVQPVPEVNLTLARIVRRVVTAIGGGDTPDASGVQSVSGFASLRYGKDAVDSLVVSSLIQPQRVSPPPEATDQQKFLQYLFPDDWDHLHIQSVREVDH